MTESRPDVTAQAIPLLREHLTLGLRRVETGRVRIHLATTSEDTQVQEPVRRERVEIQRVAVGREIAEAPGMREETVVTERRIILKKEIRIRRVTTTETIEKTVALHSQAATVERLPPAPRDGPETEMRRNRGDGADA